LKVELLCHRAGFNVQDVAGDKPADQHSQGGQVLLYRGCREFPLQLLHEGGDVKGLHVGELAASH
jgi:hypothetical protein